MAQHPAYADNAKAADWRLEAYGTIRTYCNKLAQDASDHEDFEWCYDQGKTGKETADFLIELVVSIEAEKLGMT